MKNIKYTVQAVIFNDKGEVLAVSRKDNHEDFGLAGGKVEEEDLYYDPEVFHSPMHAACHREVLEETGLDIDMFDSFMVFGMHKDGYMGYTFLINNWSGEINHNEPHVVKWTTFDTVMNGSFGKWNTLVCESLENMGIQFVKNKS